MLFGKIDTLSDPSWFTPWSLIHFINGWVAFIILKMLAPSWSNKELFIVFIAIHTVYEVKDFTITYIIKTDERTLVNSIGDTICGSLGFYVGTKFDPDPLILAILFVIQPYLMIYFRDHNLG